MPLTVTQSITPTVTTNRPIDITLTASALLMQTSQLDLMARLETYFLDESLELLEDIFGNEDLIFDDDANL